MPFIQSVYCASVLTSNNGSACAENVASGVQNALQTSHPLPVPHASKNASATAVIDTVPGCITPPLKLSDRIPSVEGEDTTADHTAVVCEVVAMDEPPR